jgi:hypothetical protein
MTSSERSRPVTLGAQVHVSYEEPKAVCSERCKLRKIQALRLVNKDNSTSDTIGSRLEGTRQTGSALRSERDEWLASAVL